MAKIRELQFSKQVEIARDYTVLTSTIAKNNKVLNDRVIANYKKLYGGKNNGK